MEDTIERPDHVVDRCYECGDQIEPQTVPWAVVITCKVCQRVHDRLYGPGKWDMVRIADEQRFLDSAAIQVLHAFVRNIGSTSKPIELWPKAFLKASEEAFEMANALLAERRNNMVR
jgi:hypothetical protein